MFSNDKYSLNKYKRNICSFYGGMSIININKYAYEKHEFVDVFKFFFLAAFSQQLFFNKNKTSAMSSTSNQYEATHKSN